MFFFCCMHDKNYMNFMHTTEHTAKIIRPRVYNVLHVSHCVKWQFSWHKKIAFLRHTSKETHINIFAMATTLQHIKRNIK